MKRFQVEVEGRIYKFEASSPEEKTKWVNALNICREYAIKHEEKSQEKMMAIDSDIRFEETHVEQDPQSKAAMLNPFGLARKLVVETVIKTGVTVAKTGVNAIKADKKSYTNEEYLKAKNLSDALASINPQILQSRLIMGYLLKETKEVTGVGLVDGFVNDTGIRNLISRKWCLLISSKPILFEEVDRSDEETLLSGKLPIQIEEEVLYIYDDSCDDSKPLESIFLKDIIDVVVKKKATTEQNYRFRLDLGEKKTNLLLESNTEMMRWVTAVQAARANLKEKTRSKLPIVKNLYWNFKILADEGERSLRKKMHNDYEKLIPRGDSMKSNDVKALVKLQEKVAEELIAIINGCLAHKDTRTDVIQIAIDIYHEAILSTLRAYFKKNQENLENRDIFDIMKFIIWYRDRLSIFGDAFIDPRVAQGITTLSKIISIRMLKTNLKTIKNIIKQDMDKEPEVNGAGKLITDAPIDIFKLLNETFNILPVCNTKELSFALLESCGYTLDYFKSGLGTILDYYKTTPDQLAAFCNNTLTYNTKIKEFTKQAEQLTGMTMLNMSQYFDEKAFAKAFVAQGKKAYEKIAYIIFSSMSEQWKKISFVEIDVEKSVKPLLERATQIEEKMYSNFASKIEAACLEKTVAFYFQSFLVSLEKKRFKSEDRSKIILKFENDTKLFADIFQNLKKGVIDNFTKPIDNFKDFLLAKSDFVALSVQNLKESYGNAIKWATIEMLIKLRDDDLEKNKKNELLKDCEEIYNTSQQKAEKSGNFNVFKHIEQDASGTALSSKRKESESSSMGDDSLSETSSNSRKSDYHARHRQSVLNLEGYLDVEKDEFLSNVGATLIATNLKFETKYFNLKRNILYYYKDKSSETAQGSYKLKDVTEFGPEENQPKMFFIKMMSSKDGTIKNLRFIAPKQDQRDRWLSILKQAKELPDYDAMVDLHASDVNFFQDTKPLFFNIEEMPDLTFPSAPEPPSKIFTRSAAESVARKTVSQDIESTIIKTPIEIEKAVNDKNIPRKRSFHLEEPVLPSLNNVSGLKRCCDRCSLF